MKAFKFLIISIATISSGVAIFLSGFYYSIAVVSFAVAFAGNILSSDDTVLDLSQYIGTAVFGYFTILFAVPFFNFEQRITSTMLFVLFAMGIKLANN
jgi:hypothetical protein